MKTHYWKSTTQVGPSLLVGGSLVGKQGCIDLEVMEGEENRHISVELTLEEAERFLKDLTSELSAVRHKLATGEWPDSSTPEAALA